MILYSYWRSTTSYRVRAVMNLLGLNYEIRPVNLVAGDQRAPDYTALNPGQGVPTLVLDDGTVLTQSMAIIDYLLATHADHDLMPDDPIAAAQIRAAVDTIALDIHPVNNLRVVGQLKSMGHSQDEAVDWMRHWMGKGLTAYQALIQPDTAFSFGPHPTLADVCLTAQMVNAHRWGLDLAPYARLVAIEAACLTLPAFDAARPENQPDAEQ